MPLPRDVLQLIENSSNRSSTVSSFVCTIFEYIKCYFCVYHNDLHTFIISSSFLFNIFPFIRKTIIILNNFFNVEPISISVLNEIKGIRVHTFF